MKPMRARARVIAQEKAHPASMWKNRLLMYTYSNASLQFMFRSSFFLIAYSITTVMHIFYEFNSPAIALSISSSSSIVGAAT